MLHVCQQWSEKARIQINTAKSQVMVFHECAADRTDGVKGRAVRRDGVKMRLPPTPFDIQRSFPSSLPVSQREMNLKEVTEFVYLGLCIDPTLSMAAAVREIKSNAGRAHALVSAVPFGP